MKKITVEVRPEHAGGHRMNTLDCLVARAAFEATGRKISFGTATWCLDDYPSTGSFSMPATASRLVKLYMDAHRDSEHGNEKSMAELLASLPQSFELEVPDGQE